jgi:ribosomal protein S18 acetylase RimI-like enzyme
MSEWDIRAASMADIGAVLAFWAASDAVPSSTDNPAALDRLISQFGGLLVVERDRELVGTLIATWDGWRGNMYRLVVDERFRRGGMGRALVTAGEHRLAAEGCQRICALVTGEHEHAVRFWSAAGYTADPTMTRYLKMRR